MGKHSPEERREFEKYMFGSKEVKEAIGAAKSAEPKKTQKWQPIQSKEFTAEDIGGKKSDEVPELDLPEIEILPDDSETKK